MKKIFTSIFNALIWGVFATSIANAQTFSYTGSLQTLTIPSCVDTVVVKAYGGAGGGGSSNDGGLGAEIIGTFRVNPGDVLDVMVGQQGLSNNEGSGGGGSFVWNTTGNVLMVAAGGGGGGYQGGVGGNGSATNTPTNGTGPQGSSAAVSGGIGGNGGTCSGSYGGGGAGAGWLSNGGNGSSCGGYGGGNGGNMPLGGGAGGTSNVLNGCSYSSNGGYGGGGASTCYAAGGGGGYNGGAGAIGFISGGNGAGGGGSYNGGINQTNVAGTNAGNGSVVITYKLTLVVATSVVSKITCHGDSNGSGKVTVTLGTGPFTYSWNTIPVQTNDTATGLKAGKYKVTVTDGSGCTTTDSLIIAQPTVVTASIGSQINVSCNGGANGSAKVTAAGGTKPYAYAWSDASSQTTPTATGLTAGSYTVAVKDSNGCGASASVAITQPPILTIAMGPIVNILCNGGSNGKITSTPSGGTAPYTYSWSDANTQKVATATGLKAGTYTVTVKDANGCAAVDSATITQPAVITVSFDSVNNVLCNGGNNASVTAAPSGGTPGYAYSWSDANTQKTATATGLKAGTYSVTVTDSNGCTAKASVIITQPTVLKVTTGSLVNILCNGGNNGSIKANPSGGTTPYTYLWSDASSQTTPTATGLTAGSYTVTATDADGCTATASATLSEPPALKVTTGSIVNILCNGGSDGKASCTPSGGTGVYTYSWSDPDNQKTATATTLTAGTYTITITDAHGCTATASATITQPPVLVVTTGSIVNILCNGGNNGKITASPSGGTGTYTYSWSDPSHQKTATATGLKVGTFTITVTDANGCTATASATITQPSVITVTMGSIVNILCNGGNNGSITATPSGGTGTYTYSWSDSHSQTSAKATGLTAGTYTVTVTDANGCSASASASTTQPSTLTVSVKPAGGILCNGGNNGSLLASPSGGTASYTYSWSDANTQKSATATGLTMGSYTVTVTDANGCTSTASGTITQPTVLEISATIVSPTVCAGNCTNLKVTAHGGTAAYTYAWSTGATNTGISVCPPVNSTYTITVTDANGCTHDTAVNVNVIPLPNVFVSIKTDSTCVGITTDSLTGTPSGGSFSGKGVVGSNFDPTAAGVGVHTILYEYTDVNGCTNSDSVKVHVGVCTGISETSALNDPIRFYPNPFSQSLNIEIGIGGTVSLTIFNILGENIGTWKMMKGLNTINTSAMPSGIYMMQIETEDKVVNRKLVKVN